MDFILYLFTQVEFIGLVILTLLVVAFLYIKDSKKGKQKKEATQENNLNKVEKVKQSKELETIANFIGDDIENDEDKMSILVANKLEKKYSDNDYYDFNKSKTFDELEGGELAALSSRANVMHGEIRKHIKRVDEEGKIIFLFDSLNFITRKHQPIILPDGTIRVQNLIKVEDELLLSITLKKPIYIYNETEQTIEKILSNEVREIVANSDIIKLSEKIKELENIKVKNQQEIELLIDENNKQNNIIKSSIQREQVLVESLEEILESNKGKDIQVSALKSQKKSTNKEDKEKEEIEKQVEKISIQEIVTESKKEVKKVTSPMMPRQKPYLSKDNKYIPKKQQKQQKKKFDIETKNIKTEEVTTEVFNESVEKKVEKKKDINTSQLNTNDTKEDEKIHTFTKRDIKKF